MKYLDENGLLYFAQKVKSWLADKADSSALTSHTGNTTAHITAAERTSWNNKVDKVSGKGLSTNDFTTTLKNKLDGIASGAEVNVQADWNVTDTSSDAYIKNKPTIPAGAKLYSATGQNTDGAMTQKAVTDALGGKANSSHTHTKSQITDFAHNHDDRYYTESEVDAKIADAISGVTQFDYEVVTELPTTGVKGKIYLIAHAHGTGDAYDEYIWVGSKYEKIGNTDLDLSGYVTTSEFNTRLSHALDSIGATEGGWKSGYQSFTTIAANQIDTNTGAIADINTALDNMVAITNAEIDTICTTA